jgi:hypothetical protein
VSGETADGGAGSEPMVLCRCYTRARRHPKVVGSVQGHPLPFGLILWTVQVGVLVASFVALMWTRGFWGQAVPGAPGQLAVLMVVPAGLTWTVRYARMEGRSPVQMLVGAAAYGQRRAAGVQVAGRAVRDRRRSALRGRRIFVNATPCGGPARGHDDRADDGRQGVFHRVEMAAVGMFARHFTGRRRQVCGLSEGQAER